LRVWLFLLPLVAAGCAFDNAIDVRFSGSSTVSVVETFSAQVSERHVSGVTTHAGQRVRADCPITIVYDVDEETGSAVLPQTYVVHLRSDRLRRRVRYDVDCSDPVILELPAAATQPAASAISAADVRTALPLGAATGVRAERGTQVVSIGWPEGLTTGDYRLELDFALPDASAFREKAVFAASVTCGRSRYLQPLLPSTINLARVPAFGVDPSAGAASIVLPHIAGANALRAQVTRRLRC
jgi:hypothetical protein